MQLKGLKLLHKSTMCINFTKSTESQHHPDWKATQDMFSPTSHSKLRQLTQGFMQVWS